jgi:dCMP deaminase
MSSGVRLKVGGVITDSNLNMVAYGYNGSIRGGDNSLEDRVYLMDEVEISLVQEYPFVDENGRGPYRLVTKDTTIHCEQNLICHAARRGISIDGGVAVLTTSPCNRCASLLYQSGVSVVYYANEYRTHKETQILVPNISYRHFPFERN